MNFERYKEQIERPIYQAFKVYLTTEIIFFADALSNENFNQEELSKSVESNLYKIRDILLDSDPHPLFDIYNTLPDRNKYTFLYRLANLVVLSTCLIQRGINAKRERHLDHQKLINNLAFSVVDGSHLGKEYKQFNPYFSHHGSRSKNTFKEYEMFLCHKKPQHMGSDAYDDFYFSQNVYLQHQLLILVVLYHRWNILPEIKYSQLYHKHLISERTAHKAYDIETSTLPDDWLTQELWKESLLNIIVHFKAIMEDLSHKPKLTLFQNIVLANIHFSREFIKNFSWDRLMDSYHLEEASMDDNTTLKNISETVAQMFDQYIQKETGRQRVWKTVQALMNIFDITVGSTKNTKLDFEHGEIIKIYNHHGKTFGTFVQHKALHIGDDYMGEILTSREYLKRKIRLIDMMKPANERYEKFIDYDLACLEKLKQLKWSTTCPHSYVIKNYNYHFNTFCQNLFPTPQLHQDIDMETLFVQTYF